MTREQIQHGMRGLGDRLKQEAFDAIEHYRDTGRVRGAKGLGRAHIRALQPLTNVFSGADCGARFASAPPAAVPALFSKGLARTVEALPWPLPSASRATVRTD